MNFCSVFTRTQVISSTAWRNIRPRNSSFWHRQDVDFNFGEYAGKEEAWPKHFDDNDQYFYRIEQHGEIFASATAHFWHRQDVYFKYGKYAGKEEAWPKHFDDNDQYFWRIFQASLARIISHTARNVACRSGPPRRAWLSRQHFCYKKPEIIEDSRPNFNQSQPPSDWAITGPSRRSHF